MSEEQHVVVELAAFPKRMARDDGRAEERTHIQYFGIPLLALEGNHSDRRSLYLRQVDRSVPDLAETRAASLQAVWTVEIEAADDTLSVAWDRVAVRIVIRGAIETARDFVVRHPATPRVVVAVLSRFRLGCSLVVFG